MNRPSPRPLHYALALVLALALTGPRQVAAQALTPAFTYQGELRLASGPATGSYDLQFRLFDAPAAGTQIGPLVSVANVAVAGGLFSLPLDFGPAQFAGDRQFLEIAIRPAGSGSFETLSPRTELTAAPYAWGAAVALANSVTTTSIVDGTIGSADINSSQVQRRVTGTCAVGEYMRTISPDGSVSCGTDAGGTLTNIATGAGLTGGPITATGTIAVADGGIGALQINPTQVQRRVTGSCPEGQYVQAIADDGTVSCGTSADPGGSVTSIATGTGLTGGPITTTGTIAVADGGIGTAQINTAQVQRRVTGTCPPGEYVRTISPDGNVSCGTDAGGTLTNIATGAGLTGGPITATGTIAIADGGIGALQINPTQVQRRVTGSCPEGQYVQAIADDGTVSCGTVTDPGGTVTSIATGAGLTGGPITTSGTIAIENNGIGTAQINPTQVQRRVSNSCPEGQYIRAIAEDGAVTCGTDATGSGGWGLGGNAGTNPATNFIGTTDNQAFVIRTRNARSLRIEPSSVTFGTPAAPITTNVIAGSHANEAWAGVRGATIAGGGVPSGNSDPTYISEAPNRVTDDFGTIGGGYANRAGSGTGMTSDAPFATVGGGRNNSAGGSGSTVGGGVGNTAANESSTVAGGVSNTASGVASTVVGGIQNDGNGPRSVIGGGIFNAAHGEQNVIGGGLRNATGNVGSTIAGGTDNIAAGAGSSIGGGDGNQVIATLSTVSGGNLNRATALGSSVGGGLVNAAEGYSSTVAGGANNAAAGYASTVSGGEDNRSSAFRSTVGGGTLNVASGDVGTVAGGENNAASGRGSTVSGGEENRSSAFRTTVGGGMLNVASGDISTVSGGENNTASNRSTTVAGGERNQASGHHSTVSGGEHNGASGIGGTVGGGGYNLTSGRSSTVSGGEGNTASGSWATVDGGEHNCAGGVGSWAGGTRAKVRPGSASGARGTGCDGISSAPESSGDSGTFVWADHQPSNFVSTGAGQFLVRASGGVAINVNNPLANALRVNGTVRVDFLGASAGQTTLCRNTSNQISACQSSSARFKHDIADLELGLATALRLRAVGYRWNEDGIADFGFVAEEMAEIDERFVFRSGKGEVEGVRYDRLTAVLANAVQELAAQDSLLKDGLRRLGAENRALRAEVAELDARHDRLAAELSELRTLLRSSNQEH